LCKRPLNLFKSASSKLEKVLKNSFRDAGMSGPVDLQDNRKSRKVQGIKRGKELKLHQDLPVNHTQDEALK
jgi:hypothetical protein